MCSISPSSLSAAGSRTSRRSRLLRRAGARGPGHHPAWGRRLQPLIEALGSARGRHRRDRLRRARLARGALERGHAAVEVRPVSGSRFAPREEELDDRNDHVASRAISRLTGPPDSASEASTGAPAGMAPRPSTSPSPSSGKAATVRPPANGARSRRSRCVARRRDPRRRRADAGPRRPCPGGRGGHARTSRPGGAQRSAGRRHPSTGRGGR